MKTSWWIAILLFVLCAGLNVGCSCGGDDDDNDAGDDSDDDSGDDDAIDDDVADDDAVDDDTTDDDAVDDDTVDDDTTDDDTVIVDVDFEDYAPGPLGSPWEVVISGASTATIVNDPTKKVGGGQMLEINGSTVFNESVEASLDFDPQTMDFTVAFDFYYEAGAVFFFTLYGDPPIQSPFNLMLLEDGLNASPNELSDPCATLSADEWTTVSVLVQPSLAKYSVLVDGEATPNCTDLDVDPNFEDAVSRLTILDIGNAGGGGIVYYDNFFLGGVM